MGEGKKMEGAIAKTADNASERNVLVLIAMEIEGRWPHCLERRKTAVTAGLAAQRNPAIWLDTVWRLSLGFKRLYGV